jgi:hypothetical protein
MDSELLVKTLSECAALLRRSGDDFWSAKMEPVAARGIIYQQAKQPARE